MSDDEQAKLALFFKAYAHNDQQALKELGAFDEPKDDCYGYILLQTAVIQQNRKIVKQLLDRGADANSKTEDGSNCLHLAVEECDDIEIVRMVLEKTNINAKDKKMRTPLMCAVLAGNSEIVQFLTEKRAKINLLDCHPMSALHYGVRCKSAESAELAKLLLRHGADPNSREPEYGDTPFLRCFKMGKAFDMDLMNLMIERDANIDDEDSRGYNCLLKAAIYCSGEVIRKLVDLGLDVTKVSSQSRRTFIHAIFEGGERDADDMISIIKLALDKGVDVNARDKLAGFTVLHGCVRWTDKNF